MFFKKKKKDELGKDHFDEYRVKPFESINDIKFGTLRKEIIEIVGKPKIHRENAYSSGYTDYYDEFFIMYDKDGRFEAIQIIMLAENQGEKFDIYYDEDKLPNNYYFLVKYFRNKYNDLVFDDGFFSVAGSVGVTITQGYKDAEAIFFGRKEYYSKEDLENLDNKNELYAINYSYDRVVLSKHISENNSNILKRISSDISSDKLNIESESEYKKLTEELVNKNNGIVVSLEDSIENIVNKVNIALEKLNSSVKLDAKNIVDKYNLELENKYINGFEVEKDFYYEVLETNIIADELKKLGYDLIGLSYNFEEDVLIVVV